MGVDRYVIIMKTTPRVFKKMDRLGLFRCDLFCGGVDRYVMM